MAQQDLAGGDIPGIAAAVDIDLNSLLAQGSGIGQMLISRFKEPDITQTQCFKVLTQFAY